MVRRYQHLLIASQDAKLLAIRRVTQDNTGKNTAGVDGIKTLSPRPPWEVFPGPAPCRSL
jgi:RNA-directed DNA polymerase